jgi:Cu(I)/Ag(I) efflux system membrane fusion protein
MKSISLKLFVLAVLLGSPACSKYSKLIKPSDVDYYTCTMHPSVHAEARGNCPICGMDLVPVMKKDSSISAAASAGGGSMQGMPGMSGMPGMPGMQDANKTKVAPSHEFVVPVERQQQIGVTYATVVRGPLHHTIRAVGMVDADMQRHWAFVARVDGYVQQLFVPSPGQLVDKGTPLMSIYSPDLLTTSRELVMLLRMRDEAKSKGRVPRRSD